MFFLKIITLLLSVLMSVFWGIRSVCLFADFSQKKGINNWQKFLMKAYQFIFNFIGSLFGWGAFYILLIRLKNCSDTFSNISVIDLILFFISLLGLTGHLPQVTYGIVKAMSDLVEKGIERIKI